MKRLAYIGASENGLYLEIRTKSTGETYRRRTNKEKDIKEYIIRNATHFVDAVIRGQNLTLFTADKTTIVVRNYEDLLEIPVFFTLFERLVKTPIVFENLKRKERTSFLQFLQLKLLYVNKTRLAALAMAGTLLVTGVRFVMNGNADFHEQQAIISSATTKQNNVFSDINLMGPVPDIKNIELPKMDEFVLGVQDDSQKDNIMDFSTRLEETRNLQRNYNGYDNSKIMIGARVDPEKVEEIVYSNRGAIIMNVGHTYGIDPYLLMAKGLAESNLDHEACCPDGIYYNGYGVGAFQLELPEGQIVKAWNYETESEDTLSITMENAINFSINAQAAAMYLQNRINLYDGNLYLALQSYNYGEEMMRVVIHDYAKQMGITEEDVKNNVNDLGWLKIVEDVHRNPNNYYYRVFIGLDEKDPQVIAKAREKYVWKYITYGNPHYIADVLSYYVGLLSQNKNLDGTSTIINFITNETKQVSENLEYQKKF